MTAQQMITEHLDLWTSAITYKSTAGRGSNGKIELTGIKKLRELILELAVRGQLVPQSPEDSSFRELVLQLREDHAPIKIRGRKTVSGEVSEDEKPFNIPKTWVWTRLGEIVDVLDSQRKPITKAARKSGPYPYYGASGIVDYVDGYLFDESLVLVGEDGAKWDKGEGTAFSISGKTWVNNHAHVLRPRREAVTDDYLVHFLTAADLNPYITGMTVPKLNQARLSSIPVATPNLEEQHRIVQKVDELMALCDRLEQQTSDQLEAHETLVGTLLGTLTQSENATELADNWARLAAHFDTLFTTEQSIDKLKQTILQLAVMGRLVEQDVGDEPAAKLVARIKAGKDLLIKNKEIKAQAKLKSTHLNKAPHQMPRHWVSASLDELSHVQGGIQKQPKRRPLENKYPYLRVADVQRGFLMACVDLPEFELFNDELKQYVLKEGDILVVEGNGSAEEIGRCAIWDGRIPDCVYQNHLMRVRPIVAETSNYLALYLNSPSGIEEMKRLAVTSSGLYNLSVGKIRSISAPLPPLLEQIRIVQKVDELMALCDQLKERLNQASETRCQLAEAIVEQAVI